MIQSIEFVSRAVSQLRTPRLSDALISISEVGDVMLHSKWKPEQLLRLSFHDVDRNKLEDAKLIEERADVVPFTPLMAKDVVDFVKGLPPKTNLTVACLAGISRSAGIAKAVAEEYNLQFNHSYQIYNRHVYRLVSNAFQEKKIE